VFYRGENPDYIAPLPTPVELTPSLATRNVMAVNYIPVWVKKSFKDKRERIINKIKTAATKETNSAPLQVDAPNTFFEKDSRDMNAIDELRKELERVNL
jgi:hypothetical protein